MTPDEFTLVLCDPTLRRVFSAVALGSSTSSEILTASGLDTPVAAKAIGQMTRNGLLVPEGRGRLALSEGLLEAVAETAARRRDEEAAAEQPDARLRGYVRDRELVSLPDEAEHEARHAVLRHVAEATFSPGAEYDERTVTERLEPWCESGALDAVSLRRALVDLDVLHRQSGLYGLTAAPVTAA